MKCFDDNNVEPSEFTNNVSVALLLNSINFSTLKAQVSDIKFLLPLSSHIYTTVCDCTVYRARNVPTSNTMSNDKSQVVNPNLTPYHTYSCIITQKTSNIMWTCLCSICIWNFKSLVPLLFKKIPVHTNLISVNPYPTNVENRVSS